MAEEPIELIGLEKLIAKANARNLLARPLYNFFDRSSEAVRNRAVKNAPVDTGRLRGSIAKKIDEATVPEWAKIGTKLSYAKPMEYGTGLLSEAPDSKGGRHFPPSDALGLWAKRHGVKGGGFAVARSIGMRGGLRPRRYMRDALKDSKGDIDRYLNVARRDIDKRWSRGG